MTRPAKPDVEVEFSERTHQPGDKEAGTMRGEIRYYPRRQADTPQEGEKETTMGIKETHTCEMTCDKCQKMFFEGPTDGIPYGTPDCGKLEVRQVQDGHEELLILCDACAVVMRENLLSQLPIDTIPGEGGLTMRLHMKGDAERRQRRQEAKDKAMHLASFNLDKDDAVVDGDK